MAVDRRIRSKFMDGKFRLWFAVLLWPVVADLFGSTSSSSFDQSSNAVSGYQSPLFATCSTSPVEADRIGDRITRLLDNKALNRSRDTRPANPKTKQTSIRVAAPRLTRALSCGTIARRRTDEMQRHVVGCVMNRRQCNRHARPVRDNQSRGSKHHQN